MSRYMMDSEAAPPPLTLHKLEVSYTVHLYPNRTISGWGLSLRNGSILSVTEPHPILDSICMSASVLESYLHVCKCTRELSACL
jgi:hypothetical protein